MNTPISRQNFCSSNRHIKLISRISTSKVVIMKAYANQKLPKCIISMVLILVMLSFSFAFGLLTGTATITSSGTISVSSTILPLHTDGPYVKDSLNRSVYLRGVNIPSGFTASCTGAWYQNGDWIWGYSYTHWDATGLQTRLQEAKNRGFNTIRLIFNIDWMKADSATNLNGQTTYEADGTTVIHIREAILRSARAAAPLGIYIVIAPYPPGDPMAHFSSTAQFVSFWGTLAQLYGNEPNVLFEPWGEPVGDYNTWVNTLVPQATAAIRVYTQNPVIVQYGYCGGFGFADDVWATTGQYGNIIMSNHIYRYPPGATFTTSETTTAQIESKLRNTWDYGSVIGVYPMYIGEIGAWVAYGSGETTWWTNILALLNQWGAGYSAWEWGQLGTGWQLQNDAGAAPYSLNTNGQVFVNAIAAGTP